LWLREVSYSLDLLGERGEAVVVDVMTEEVQLLHTEDALVGVDHNPMMREALEYRAYILEVLFQSSTGNQNVIDVCVG